jgi:ABC-type Zn uptake system ZnuABC Zn-binding protein ZnuA
LFDRCSCSASCWQPAPRVIEQLPALFAAGTLQVHTVNYPLAYFAECIDGDRIEEAFPVPVEVDPAFWMPDTDTMAAY